MYIQAFDNEKRQCLTALLEQEKWKKSDMVSTSDLKNNPVVVSS